MSEQLYLAVPPWCPRIATPPARRPAPLTGIAGLTGWPPGMRLLVRKERPHPGAQLRFTDSVVVKTGGTVSIYAKHGGDEYSVPILETYFKNLRYQYLVLYSLHAEALAQAASDVTAAIACGFRIGEDSGLPIHHFPFAEAAAAQDAVEQGTVGKVLLDIAET